LLFIFVFDIDLLNGWLDFYNCFDNKLSFNPIDLDSVYLLSLLNNLLFISSNPLLLLLELFNIIFWYGLYFKTVLFIVNYSLLFDTYYFFFIDNYFLDYYNSLKSLAWVLEKNTILLFYKLILYYSLLPFSF
jgi:hypothetical protein